MAPPISARPIYQKREVPKDPAQLPGWLQTELGNVQRAFIPTRSRTVLVSGPVQSTDTVIYADATAGAIVLTLPSPNQVKDLVVTVKKVDSSGYAVTLVGQIDGSSSYVFAAQYDAATIGCDGVQFYLLSTV